jgi:stringent starvation protein B
MDANELPSTKPYLLRAIWEWCSDHGYGPYIAVAVDARTRVPREYVKDEQIVLNIGQDATNQLRMGNEYIEFQARFGGVARELSIPIERVMAIYARENGAGMSFEVSDTPEPPDESLLSPQTPPPEPPPAGSRPKLQRIK